MSFQSHWLSAQCSWGTQSMDKRQILLEGICFLPTSSGWFAFMFQPTISRICFRSSLQDISRYHHPKSPIVPPQTHTTTLSVQTSHKKLYPNSPTGQPFNSPPTPPGTAPWLGRLLDLLGHQHRCLQVLRLEEALTLEEAHGFSMKPWWVETPRGYPTEIYWTSNLNPKKTTTGESCHSQNIAVLFWPTSCSPSVSPSFQSGMIFMIFLALHLKNQPSKTRDRQSPEASSHAWRSCWPRYPQIQAPKRRVAHASISSPRARELKHFSKKNKHFSLFTL